MSHQNRSKKTRRISDNPTPEQILQLRESLNMSVEDFADAGFYSATSILAFESGTKRMHPFIWMAYKHILGVQDLVKIK